MLRVDIRKHAVHVYGSLSRVFASRLQSGWAPCLQMEVQTKQYGCGMLGAHTKPPSQGIQAGLRALPSVPIVAPSPARVTTTPCGYGMLTVIRTGPPSQGIQTRCRVLPSVLMVSYLPVEVETPRYGYGIAVSGEHKTTLTGHQGSVNSVAFSPDSTTLASGGGGGRVLLWDVASGYGHQSPLTGHTPPCRRLRSVLMALPSQVEAGMAQ